MQTNWSTTTTQVNLEELVALQEKLRRKCENEFLTKLPYVFQPIEPIEFKWLEPQTPEGERLDAIKFRVFTDMAMNFGVPKHVLFAADFDAPKSKPNNKWLRIAALVAAVIVFVLMWSQR